MDWPQESSIDIVCKNLLWDAGMLDRRKQAVSICNYNVSLDSWELELIISVLSIVPQQYNAKVIDLPLNSQAIVKVIFDRAG